MTIDSGQWFRVSQNRFRDVNLDGADTIAELIESLPQEEGPYVLIWSHAETIEGRYRWLLDVVQPRDIDNLDPQFFNFRLASEKYSPGIVGRLDEETKASLSLQGMPCLQYRLQSNSTPLSIGSIKAIANYAGDRIDHVEYAALFKSLLAAAKRLERKHAR